jgi:multiple sugar transport system permease protein
MVQNLAVRHAGAGRRVARARTWSAWSDRHFKWLLVAPAITLILALTVYPLAYSVWVAFVNFDFQIPGHAFVGLQNFEYVVEDPIARWSLLTTAFLSVSSVVLEFLLGLGLAIAMTRTFAARGVIMLILIVPLFVSPVVVGQIWSLILQKPYGPFDYLVGLLFRPTEVSWLTGSPWKFISLIVADVWQWTPFMFIVIFAGLRALPKSPFEAAAIDGAGPIRTFVSVTLPMLKPVIVVAALLRIVDAMRTYDTVYIITRGGPDFSTDLVSVYLQRVNFKFFDLGYGAALSWLTLIVILALVLIFVQLTGFMKLLSDKESR